MNFIFKCYFLNMYNKSVLKLAYKSEEYVSNLKQV